MSNIIYLINIMMTMTAKLYENETFFFSVLRPYEFQKTLNSINTRINIISSRKEYYRWRFRERIISKIS